MRWGVTVWNGRVSPLFDSAGRLETVDVENGSITSKQEHSLPPDDLLAKVNRLSELGVEALVCGAVSRPLAEMIAERGIRLIPFVAGDVAEIVGFLLAGKLLRPDFAMPGCCRRRRFHGGTDKGDRGCRRGRDRL
jgi:predicted Fe-Mo cluster-binding NifX family protein